MTLKIINNSQLVDTVAVVMGTRPGIVKMAPIVKELTQKRIKNEIIHTGQHYSENMDKDFFHALELPIPRYRVDKTKDYTTHADQTAEMLKGVESVLFELKPKIVLVCGDANTNLAAGLAARKLGIIVGHVEAGLRSHDWSMPEEHNRIILDHICELLFAPTPAACENLVRDNVRGEIHYTGNTIVDATLENIVLAEEKMDVLSSRGIVSDEYVLLTCHREENVDVQERFESLLEGVLLTKKKMNKKIIFPAHPRTMKRLKEFEFDKDLSVQKDLVIIEPVGYLEFLVLMKNASLIMTDSGGIQEEACILHTPCVTLRDNTERPETIEVGSNTLSGVMSESILKTAQSMIKKERKWEIPFGDGKASKRIVDITSTVLQKGFTLPVYSKSRIDIDENFLLKKV